MLGLLMVLINMQYHHLPPSLHFTSLVTFSSSKQTKTTVLFHSCSLHTKIMAFALKSVSISFLLLLCLVLLLQLYDGINGVERKVSSMATLKEVSNRKLLVVKDVEENGAVFKIHGKKEEENGWELRAAPLGPDPLHHHGADPKKPRTP